ncbi:hypothetical protein R3P38DRAFT_3130055 [Favolaschia claudopus]|uniref:Uncharacterized protein n=1 Tax=Favolaschia claudopus TaxID=2862362 RepID=A0AAV9Z9F9_9AGAR
MDATMEPLRMRLTDRDAWEVVDSDSVVEGVDLLKNRPSSTEQIGALDGRAAAYFVVGHASYFITTNARYVPLLPPIDPKQIMVRRDMRYGPDDPVLWPHLYSQTYCHLAAIPKAPKSSRNLRVMWWNPRPDDFVCPASGLTVTRGLGRLRFEKLSQISTLAHSLLDDYDKYLVSLNGATPTPLLPKLAQTLRLSLERLRIPSTYARMQLGVVCVQREYLELAGLLAYMTKYKPRMEGVEDADAKPSVPDDCIGCFTEDPFVAQMFWRACLPCWFIRPLKAFADEMIWRVVRPFEAADFLEMLPAPGYAPVPATDRLEQRLSLLHSCTHTTPWYHDPFAIVAADTTSVASSSTASTSSIATASGSLIARSNVTGHLVGGSSRGRHGAGGKGHGISPYAAARQERREAKAAKGPNPAAKPARDKFKPLERFEMPTSITPWTEALAAIDQATPPACGPDRPQYYVLPEPALILSSDDESRRRLLLHHYCMLRDALMFRLTDRSVRPQPLTTQEWRDVLQGKLVKQGKHGSRAETRSFIVEDLLRPALQACGIDGLKDFPVAPNAVPTMNVHFAKELVWELAEMSFRFEFLALDSRASQRKRPDECRKCFAGDGLVGLDFRESQRGLAALALEERMPYLLGMARLMCDWIVPCPRPPEIEETLGRPISALDRREMHKFERRVASYYAQSFYELFGRAAIIPMRLEHEIGS